ncbi:alcohol oxidase [Lindgomyces ingoldianus]|uniref:Alcohol oxidase n=1 Tax=Lindgomyces ingoldianus TaxID=673940 RepID=A0ACB6Q7Y8_9PLEO|nr:alcohol oxidase [Lindgomyces ingoldianus]KAF2462976.1 alcohol oxidase [Lindgomyces ingoldianus]
MVEFIAVIAALVAALIQPSSAGPLLPRSGQLGTLENATFDYVVIGGGTAGLTIAARLAKFASVAVIEAGGYYEVDYGNASVVPLLSLTGLDVIDPSTSFPHRPEIDWELVTIPQTNAANRVLHYAQGKTLGGSSAINTMSYIRSTKSAYQRWADLVGDGSYTFSNLLPYFKKSVHLTPPNLAKRNAANATPEYDPDSFGIGSPLEVSWNNWVDPTLTWLAKCLQAVGLTINPKGFSSGELNGGSWLPSTIDPTHATRDSSQTSFLDEAMPGTQIKVYSHSMATKILFDGSKAKGVSVSTNGTLYTLSVNKEVIVSGGVFHSPQILMVSGVGPKAVLQAQNIPVVADLPGVGQNLQDPISINVANFVNTPNAQSIVANLATEPEALRQYREEAAGPYSSAAGYISYERLPTELRATLSNATQAALAAYPSDWPELQYIVGTFLSSNGSSMGAISATITTTFSRGSVTIASASITDAPVINLGWFSNSADGEVLIAGVKRVRQAWSSEPAQSIRLGPEFIPGVDVDTDAKILDFLKNNVNMIWHASSTCAMGKIGDKMAVVDSKAKVFGVQGLRVVDISIFPFSPPGHPQASVFMIAEKIADDIENGR